MKQKGFSQIILIVAIVGALVAIGGGAWYFRQSFKQETAVPSPDDAAEQQNKSEGVEPPPFPAQQGRQVNGEQLSPPEVTVPEVAPSEEVPPLTIPEKEIRVDNLNAYISNQFSAPSFKELRQITIEAFSTFTSEYRGKVKRLVVLSEYEFQRIIAEDPWLLPEDKSITNAYADRKGNIFINGDRLLRGLSVINPDKYNANDGPEDVIIHEIAHVVLDNCQCINDWISINVEHYLDGIVSDFAKDYWAIAHEVFAETVVGYQNSGGDPTKIFTDSKNLEALRIKFQFLEKHSIVEKNKI